MTGPELTPSAQPRGPHVLLQLQDLGAAEPPAHQMGGPSLWKAAPACLLTVPSAG